MSKATSPAKRSTLLAPARSCTAGAVSTISKNSPIFGAWRKSWLTKPTACSSRPMSMVARLMKVTMSPIVASPLRCSHVPVMKIAVTVSVAEARVATEASAHQDRTGFWAASSWWMIPCRAWVSAWMRVKDWMTGMLPSASEACSARFEW